MMIHNIQLHRLAAFTVILTSSIIATALAQQQPADDQPHAAPTSQPAPAPHTPVAEDPDIIERLEAIAAQHADVTDLHARFTQTREAAALRRAVTSTGTVRVRGDASHWATTDPYRYDMWVRAGEVSFYYPDDQLVEIYDLSDIAAHLVFGPDLDLPALRAQFIISRGDPPPTQSDLSLCLTPRSDADTTLLSPMNVVIDPTTGHVRSIVTVDQDNNRTTLSFTDVRTNVGITDETLKPAWPGDVTVQRIKVDPRSVEQTDTSSPADPP